MTRDEALQKLWQSERPKSPPLEVGVLDDQHRQFIANVEALGLITFEEPPVPEHEVPAVRVRTPDGGGNFSAMIREDTLIETLRMAGYTVRKVIKS